MHEVESYCDNLFGRSRFRTGAHFASRCTRFVLKRACGTCPLAVTVGHSHDSVVTGRGAAWNDAPQRAAITTRGVDSDTLTRPELPEAA